MIILVQTNMINKTTLLIINLLTCFGSLLSHPQKQYDVVITKKNFFLQTFISVTLYLLTETII